MNSDLKNQLPECYSLYWKNISSSILLNQRKVFDFLGINLVQDLDDLREHGDWIKEKIETSNQEIIVIADIDAIPTSINSYIYGVKSAKKHGIFGLAQFSNNDLYAV